MASNPVAVLERASDIFDRQFQEIKTINLNTQNKLWYDDVFIAQFKKFAQLLTLITTLIDKCDTQKNLSSTGNQLLSKKQVFNLYSYLYNKLVSSIKWLSPAVPTETDKFMNSQILAIYFSIATCVLFLKEYWPLEPDNEFYKKQTDILYCKDFNLVVSSIARICDFSMEELVTSLDQIELRIHDLQYHEDLVNYVNALEIRVCEFLLYLYDDKIHNVKSHCSEVEPGRFGCTTSAEYEIVIKLMSVREALASSLECLRTHDASDHTLQDVHLAKKIHASLMSLCGDIYSDTIPQKFYDKYTEETVTTSEGYSYYMIHGVHVRLDMPSIIRQFRNVQQWSVISAEANLPLVDFISKPHENFLAFKIIFHLLLDLAFAQSLEENWQEYFIKGSEIRRYPKNKLEATIESSKKTPIFIESFNDACVMTDGNMYVFGNEPEDYFTAFAFWMEIVASKHFYRLKESIIIYPLISLMLGKEPDVRKQSSEIIGSTISMRLMEVLHFEDGVEAEDPEDPRPPLSKPRQPQISQFVTGATSNYFLNIFNNRIDSIRAELKIRDVLSDPTAREISAAYVVDVDETGIPSTGVHGW